MASCYGPTSVSTCPLLVFKRAAYSGEDGGFRGACGSEWSLVATGSLANVEPDRIMLKKVRAWPSAAADSLYAATMYSLTTMPFRCSPACLPAFRSS
jgi:hypothetical protein